MHCSPRPLIFFPTPTSVNVYIMDSLDDIIHLEYIAEKCHSVPSNNFNKYYALFDTWYLLQEMLQLAIIQNTTAENQQG